MPSQPPLEKLLADAETAALDQVARVLTQRFEELSSRLAQEFTATRREQTETLNQAVRRLRDADSPAEWSRALLDATAGFCDRAALFSVAAGRIQSLGSRNLPLADDCIREMPLAASPAFVSAVESKEPVAAMRSLAEFSAELIAALGESDARRVHLFLLANRRTDTAVLYVEEGGEPFDAAGLELLAAVAGMTREPRLASRKLVSGLHAIEAPGRRIPLDWSELTAPEQETHLKAQRFARVKVAGMRLYKSDHVKAGRSEKNLYAALQQDIDEARREFEADFMRKIPTMLDYLHIELLRTLANDDEATLGPDYPGPLV